MTRYRVPFSGGLVVAVAAALTGAAFDAQAQAKASGRARLINSSNQTYCDNYTSVTTYPDGAVEIQCTGTAPTPSPSPTPSPTPTPTPAPTTPTPSAMLSPAPGSNLTSSSITFVWDTGFGVGDRYFTVGTTVGGAELYGGYQGTGTSRTVTGVPTNQVVYVGLSSWVNGGWQKSQYTYNGGGTTPTPTPTPAPTPTPGAVCVNSAGQSIAEPANVVMQQMLIGGSNNYVFDALHYTNIGNGTTAPSATGPENTVQVFPLPKTWGDGTAVTNAFLSFVSYVRFNLIGAQYEVAFSKCKGDFSFYKTPQATVNITGNPPFTPCGSISGSDNPLAWGVQGNFMTCPVPANEQWYMNWRVVPGTCPVGYGNTCGQTFYVPRG